MARKVPQSNRYNVLYFSRLEGARNTPNMAYSIDKERKIRHIWRMLKTAVEIRQELGQAIRERRVAYGLSQHEAATRAGVGFRTWQRMEADGPSQMENLISASIVLRCEDVLSGLFPKPAASSMDELLMRQAASKLPSRKYAPRRSGAV
jgi:transcriptional regulator with XRE-family HTH domain